MGNYCKSKLTKVSNQMSQGCDFTTTVMIACSLKQDATTLKSCVTLAVFLERKFLNLAVVCTPRWASSNQIKFRFKDRLLPVFYTVLHVIGIQIIFVAFPA